MVLVSGRGRAALEKWFGAERLGLVAVSPQATYRQELLAGFILVLPIVFHQLWLFIAPGLTRKEKKLAVPFVTASTVSFCVGAMFFLLLIWPVIINFSLSYEAEGLRSWFNLSAYVNFCLRLLVLFGLIFELPVLTLLLFLGGGVLWLYKNRAVAPPVVAKVAVPAAPVQAEDGRDTSARRVPAPEQPDPSRDAFSVAPVFIHGEGRGALGCVVVSPPVFLSEAEALEVLAHVGLRQVLRQHDAVVDVDAVGVEGDRDAGQPHHGAEREAHADHRHRVQGGRVRSQQQRLRFRTPARGSRAPRPPSPCPGKPATSASVAASRNHRQPGFPCRRPREQKSEIRSTKSETNPKSKAPMTETLSPDRDPF